MRHFSAFDAVGTLRRKKRRVDEIDARSCIEETCGNTLGCSFTAIAEGELVRWFETYCNVQRIYCKWELFAVAYCWRDFLP